MQWDLDRASSNDQSWGVAARALRVVLRCVHRQSRRTPPNNRKPHSCAAFPSWSVLTSKPFRDQHEASEGRRGRGGEEVVESPSTARKHSSHPTHDDACLRANFPISVQQGNPRMGLLVVLLFDTYACPSAALPLQAQHLLAPSALAQSPFWAIMLKAGELHEPGKT